MNCSSDSFIRLFAILALGLCPAVAADEHVESPSDFVRRWAAAINENKAEKQLALYDHSDATQVIVSSGHHYHGFGKIEEVYRKAFAEVEFSDSEAKEITARAFGDTAVVAFEHRFRLQLLADGSKWQARIKTSAVLRKDGASWKIAFEHSSPINGVERLTPIDE